MLREGYTERLAHSYSRVSTHALAESAAAVAKRGEQLLSLFGDTVPSRLVTAARDVVRQNSNRAGDSHSVGNVERGSTQLRETALAAVSHLKSEAERLQEVVNRYDRMCLAFVRHAAALEFPSDEVQARIERYADEMRERSLSHSDFLAENRYDSAVFRRILVEEVLDQSKLAALVEGIGESISTRLSDGWLGLAQRYGIALARSERDTPIQLEMLVAAFLQPIQLFYERPSVLRSMLQALGRGKFEEKLREEVETGFAEVTGLLRESLVREWEAAATRWQALATSAAQVWFNSFAGEDRDACLARVADRREQARAIATWVKRLEEVTVAHTIYSWGKVVRTGAVSRIAERLHAEQR